MSRGRLYRLNRATCRRSSYVLRRRHTIKIVIKFLLWLILLIVCWPLALLALILYPLVWLIMLPFRLIGVTIDGLFGLIKALFTFPARVLSGKSGSAH